MKSQLNHAIGIESCNFQFDFVKPFKISVRSEVIVSMGNKSCSNELKFCDISQNLNQTDADNFSFLERTLKV